MLASQACQKQLPSVQGLPLLTAAAAAAAVCQTGGPEVSLAWRCWGRAADLLLHPAVMLAYLKAAEARTLGAEQAGSGCCQTEGLFLSL